MPSASGPSSVASALGQVTVESATRARSASSPSACSCSRPSWSSAPSTSLRPSWRGCACSTPRTRRLSTADALDERAAYEAGVLDQLAITDESVASAATAHLARTPLPSGITAWSVVPDTGTSDGATAVVTIQGTATLPMSGWVLESLGGSVTITVTSRARAPLG